MFQNKPVPLLKDKNRTYIPQPSIGYELTDEEFGFFSVIVPEATINYVQIPTFVSATLTGYTAINSSIARSTDYVYTWNASIKCTPSSLSDSGLYYGITITNTYTYTFSVFLRARNGEKIDIYATNSVGTRISAKKTYVGNNNFTRVWITFTANSAAEVRLTIVKRAGQSVLPFYATGFQCEQKAYPTTYVDGGIWRKYFSFTGMPDTPDIYWLKTPYASISYRNSTSRLGGKQYRFSDLGLKVMGVVGLGNIPSENIMDETNAGYTYYQRTIPRKRVFSIVCTMFGKSISDIAAQRELLLTALSPINNLYDTPILLQYNVLDRFGQVCKIFDIECMYISGLEGMTDGYYSDSITLQFEMADSYIKDYGEICVESGLYETLSPKFLGVLKRDSTGQWESILATNEAVSTDLMQCGCSTGDYVYIGHTDNTINGVANTEGVFRIHKITHVVEPLVPGVNILSTGFFVDAMLLDEPNDCIYIGGWFSNVGGNANADNIVKYNITARTYSAMGTGVDDYVTCITPMTDGTSILVGGLFASCGGVANTNKVAKWDGSQWVSIQSATWANSTESTPICVVETICVDGSNVYVGGHFNITGVSGTEGIMCITPSAVTSVGGGLTGGTVNKYVQCIFKSSDGYMYVGGGFTGIGNISCESLARWNGSSYKYIASTLEWYYPAGSNKGTIYKIRERNSVLYICGAFENFNGVILSQSICTLVNNVVYPFDIILDTDTTHMPEIRDFIWDEYGSLYLIGRDIEGTTTIASSRTSISLSTPSTAKVYPWVEIYGPGEILSLTNNNTGKSVYLRYKVELQSNTKAMYTKVGEIIVINFRKDRLSITSLYGSAGLRSIGDGSDLDWYLLPGSNYISVFMYKETDANTKFRVGYRNTYLSLDSAIKENRFAK